MKWSELPQEYRDLENNFKPECKIEKDKEFIDDRFYFSLTPQGGKFWYKCYKAESIADLPPITITDYPENIVKEPEKEKRYFIVFWASENGNGYSEFITYKGNYLSYKEFQKNEPEKPITNIIELSESDYNDFIA